MCWAAGFEFLNIIVIVIEAKLSNLSQNQTWPKPELWNPEF